MREITYTLKLDRYDYGIIFKRGTVCFINGNNVLLKVIDAKERYKGRDSYGR